MEKSENKCRPKRPNAGKSYSEYQDDLAQKTNEAGGDILKTIIIVSAIFMLYAMVRYG